jgi:hexosaminidase
MKRLFYVLIFFALAKTVYAQVRLPVFPDSLFSTYYHQRVTHFNSLPDTKGDIVFVGNSITDGAEWSELFNDLKIKNRGISGDVSTGVLHRLKEEAQRKPEKIFLLIGINDQGRNMSPDSLVKNILIIASYLKQETPSTQLFVQSILPVNDIFRKFAGHTRKGTEIKQVNGLLQQQADKYSYSFIDMHTPFSDQHGKLKTAFTNDGLHLTGKGYLLWKHLIYPFVYGLQRKCHCCHSHRICNGKAVSFLYTNVNPSL